MNNKIRFLTIFVGLSLSSSLFASGFQTLEQSAVNLGRANADGGLAGDDLSAIYYNPAAMTLLSSGLKLQFGGAIVSASSDYKDSGSGRALVSRQGKVLSPLGASGTKTADPGTVGVPPFAYLAGDISPNLKWGVGVFVPFGLSTEYKSDWVGRYHAIESAISSIDINPSIAYRVSDAFSVGAGVSFQYLDATLSKAVFTGTPNDGLATVTADGWSTGFNVGATFSPSKDTRFGLSYRSSVKHDVDGKRKLTGLGPRSGTIGGSTSVELPDQIAFSAFHRVSPTFDLMASVRWTGWSNFEKLRLKFDDGTEDVTPENWEDTITVAIGGDYHASKQMTYRAGIAYDQSPIPDENFRTPRIPGNDRIWLSGGFTYSFDKNWSLDLGYTHVFIESAKVNNRIPIGQNKQGIVIDHLKGKYENSGANLFSAQIRYDF